MKKYRLIKKYPGSPELGYISKPHIAAPDNAHYWNHTWFYPTDYPEYWEEVKEPEYEILELIQDFKYPPYNTNIWKLQPDGKYTLVSSLGHGTFTLMQLLVNSNAKIHQVKRLSDNTIFTIGDIVEYNASVSSKGIIDGFKICKNINKDIVAILSNDPTNTGKLFLCVNNNKGNIRIDKAVKFSKVPLFTTEDDVEIFEGDKFWVPQKSPLNHWTDKEYTLNGKIEKFKAYPRHKDQKCISFSTKEKAQEYIDYNKPKFSKNKVIEIIDETLPKKETIPFWNYIDRLKDKIKNIN